MCKFNCLKNLKFQKSDLIFGLNAVGSLHKTILYLFLLSSFTVKGGKVKWEFPQAPLQLEEHAVENWSGKFKWKSLGALVS